MKTSFIRLSLLLISSYGLLHFQPVLAHHSRANFQLDSPLELTGTVTRFRWANPHLYFELETDDGENWTISGHSVPGVLALGWNRDTIKEGDRIRFAAFPDKDPNRKYALLDWVVTTDGIALRGFSGTKIPPELLSTTDPRSGDSVPETIQPSADFSGNWANDLRGRDLRRTDLESGGGPPLTALGQQQAAAHDPDDNPGFQCIPVGIPRILGLPYDFRFDRFEDRIEMTKELQDVRWTVWLDEMAAPANSPPSAVGTSIGRIEGENVLVFETGDFTAELWGHGNGIDSSDQKRVSARLELQPDGTSIEYSYTVTDPVYLAEPQTVTGTLIKKADRSFDDIPPCDTEVSTLHLRVD